MLNKAPLFLSQEQDPQTEKHIQHDFHNNLIFIVMNCPLDVLDVSKCLPGESD